MPAQTPLLGWPIPLITEPADGPSALLALGAAAEQEVGARQVTAYTPNWLSAGPANPSNPTAKTGAYRVAQGWCDFHISISFGVSTSGGIGSLYVTLPVATSAAFGVQIATAMLWVPGFATFMGVCRLDPGAVTCWAHFPWSLDGSGMELWRSVDTSGAAGTSIPVIPGSYSIRPGGYFTCRGRYMAA